MSSIRRVLASPANGALSHGPVTPSGKLTCSQNALRHGLLAGSTLIQGESEDDFAGSLRQLVARYRPTDGVELSFVEEMASAVWRMRRAWSIEARTLDTLAAAQSHPDQPNRISAAFLSPDNLAAQSLLQRYETRLHLMYRRALQNLLLVRNSVVADESGPVCRQLPESTPDSEAAPVPLGAPRRYQTNPVPFPNTFPSTSHVPNPCFHAGIEGVPDLFQPT
jgi:hypothetical protein